MAFAFVVLAGRPLGAAEPVPTAGFKQVRLGKAVVSLPAQWPSWGPEVPVWLHLHGATNVVEANFASIGAPGVLVTLTLPGLSKAYADYFAAPEVFPTLLAELETLLRSESSTQSWRVGHVTVSSFSAGFGGVRQLLRQPGAFARISAVVLADSLYAGYAGPATERRVDPELMAGFVNFARLAADGKKRMVISHSRQVPEGYASTTETADYLIGQLDGARTEETRELAGGLQLTSEFTRGQLAVLGFAGEGPEDHLRHLRALGVFLDRVAPRVAHGARSVAELRGQLARHLGQERFARAVWGVKVASLDTGRVLFEEHADRLLSPASNSKLYTGALALDRLGGDYRIRTPVLATAKPDAAGTVAGDLIVSGRGDPGWNSGSARKNFDEIFARFGELLDRAGVRRITGDLIGDATYFRGVPYGAGWTADDLNDYYGAEVSAIALEDNYVDLRLTPAVEAGRAAQAVWMQPHTGLVFDNRAVTIAKGGMRNIQVRRLPGETVVHVFGEIPTGAAPFVTEATVPRPALWFAAALKEALARRGIAVEGQARSRHWPDAPASAAAGVELGEIQSAPLRELVAGFLKPSQNLQTDLIFAHLGELARPAGTPEWRSSEQCAVSALREFLQRNELFPDDVRFEEGSGLSRNNLTTARATVALLTFMAKHREAEAFSAALPVAGTDGTLRRRLKATPAEGNVRAKTGTLRWANALSGYVTTAAGERLVFSAILNRAVTPSGQSARDDVDAIAELLARFQGRSDAEVSANAAGGRD